MTASVSFFTTRQQKADLRALGYSDDDISKMKPAQAHGILGINDPGSNGGWPQSDLAHVDPMAQQQQFLAHLRRGGAFAYLWTLPGRRSYWYGTGDDIPEIDATRHNVYFGVHPTISIPTENSKGQTATPDRVRSQIPFIAAINCLFSEFDAKDFVPEMVKAALQEHAVKTWADLSKEAKGPIVDAGRPLALAHVQSLAPAPSVVIDSGGGYHCYWLLVEPYTLDTNDQTSRAVRLQWAWVHHTGGDRGASDLARVLRLPGSHNRKYNPPRSVAFITFDLELLYALDDLEKCAGELAKPRRLKPRKQKPQTKREYTRTDSTEKARQWLDRLASWRCDDYFSWLNVGFALCELGATGLALWDSWSQKSDKYDSREIERKWPTFTPGDGITLGSLSFWADQDDPADRPGFVAQQGPIGLGDAGTDPIPGPIGWQPLPESARIAPGLGRDACKWLDDYIEFSRLWSPRSFDGFHEAAGLWLLSTISARRCLVHFGEPRYGNIYVMLAGRTTIHAKTSATGSAKQTLKACGLGFLLAPDEVTPASFVQRLANLELPANWENLPPDAQNDVLLKMGFASKRGWYYEEFGSGLQSMMRADGIMADFRGLLRIFDDCPDSYRRSTIARGMEGVQAPYLALIGNLTPADLQPLAKKGSMLWGDGFLARFALITPPANEILLGRYPEGERVIPRKLVTPLVDWHRRLGMPIVDVVQSVDGDGEPEYHGIEIVDYPQHVIGLPSDVKDAIYVYLDSLIVMACDGMTPDLDGNLGRYHIKALRIALLFASLDGSTAITMNHWTRAREITERWRLYTHRAYQQVAEAQTLSTAAQNADKVVRLIKSRARTIRELTQGIRGLGTAEAIQIVTDQVVLRYLVERKRGKTLEYAIANHSQV